MAQVSRTVFSKLSKIVIKNFPKKIDKDKYKDNDKDKDILRTPHKSNPRDL